MNRSDEANPTGKAVELQPSQTAMGTVFLRAMAAVDRRSGIRGPDDLAQHFLPDDRRIILQDPALIGWVIRNSVSPGMYEFLIARTAWFDGIVKLALAASVPQIVFLGAGYDSRPYRFRDLIGETRIFEMDMPKIQEHKRKLLERARIPIPEQLTFVPVDFRTGGIGGKLGKAGFDPGLEALFVWEGVTYYLPGKAVNNTLKAIRDHSYPGSTVCFDYASRSPEKQGSDRVQKLKDNMKSSYPEEPACFALRDGEIESFLEKRGYRILENLTSEDMEARYLNLPDRALAGTVPSVFSFVWAELL